MKKVAIELFGQLRMWDAQNLYKFESFLLENKISVDYFGTFWDDEYTNSYVDKGVFESFKKLQLLDEPEYHGNDLTKYFLSFKKSIQQRKQYQSENNVEYTFVIHARSDLEYSFDDGSYDKLENLLKLIKENSDKPSVFVTDVERIRTDQLDDKILISNVMGANALMNTYDTLPEFPYHKSLMDAVKLCGCEMIRHPVFFCYNLIRHKICNSFNFNDGFFTPEISSKTNTRGDVRQYIKTIQDTQTLKDELIRLNSFRPNGRVN
tara:strand:+ start:330 stop:1121 length:792 start_codon:yes stop_codon:yes gene_type:complete